MPEGDDRAERQALPDHAGRQREVVVLHEHQRRLGGTGFFSDGVGEAAVDHPVGVEIVGPEHRADVGLVAQRPQRFVGESVVVALLFLVVHPHAPEAVLGARRADLESLVDRSRSVDWQLRIRARPTRRCTRA